MHRACLIAASCAAAWVILALPLGVTAAAPADQDTAARPEAAAGAGIQDTQAMLAVARMAGTLQAPQVTASITIKDASRDVEVPVKVAVEGAKLTASGEFDVLQTEFGIKPFSVALGALEVQDRLHIKFTIIAAKK